jgi:hypothetical protein
MPKSKTHGSLPANRLLATLPRKDYERLLPALEEIPLLFEEVLYEAGEPILDVYFPTVELYLCSPLLKTERRSKLDSWAGKVWSACPYSWR